MDWTTWAPIITQIPIVALFAWFVDRMIERQDKHNGERDASWQQFLSEERQVQQEARKAAMQHGMDSLVKLNECTEKLAEAVYRHGDEASSRFELLTKELHELRGEIVKESRN